MAKSKRATTMSNGDIALQCPQCGTRLAETGAETITCAQCGADYPVVDGIPMLMPVRSDIKVRTFFERVDETIDTDHLSYTPDAPAYMELQFRILASAIRRSMLRWLPEGTTILDVGCGHGDLLLPVAERFRICGIDFSFGLLKAARDRGYRVYQGDATRLPFADNQFDAVVCFEVLQHFPDPSAMIAELARVCRPGGTVIFSTLNAKSYLRRLLRKISRLVQPRSFDLPIINRPVDEVIANGQAGGLNFQRIVWVLSPTYLLATDSGQNNFFEPFATNHITFFEKPEQLD